MSIVADLTAQYRLEAFDKAANNNLLSDSDVLMYLRQAETEACRRGLIIRDVSTSAICNYAVTADNPWITIDSRIIKIKTAELWTPNDDDPTIIAKTTMVREHQRDLPNRWQDETGEPRAIVTDVDRGKVRLYPIPTHDGTLKLGVIRLPLADMTTTPEIPLVYHPRLVDWVTHRAYVNADPDLYYRQVGLDAYARFEAAFGPSVSVNDDLWIGDAPNRRRSHTRFF